MSNNLETSTLEEKEREREENIRGNILLKRKKEFFHVPIP